MFRPSRSDPTTGALPCPGSSGSSFPSSSSCVRAGREASASTLPPSAVGRRRRSCRASRDASTRSRIARRRAGHRAPCARRPPSRRCMRRAREVPRAWSPEALLADVEAGKAAARRARLADARALVGRRVRIAEAHRRGAGDRARGARGRALHRAVARLLIERSAAHLARGAVAAVVALDRLTARACGDAVARRTRTSCRHRRRRRPRRARAAEARARSRSRRRSPTRVRRRSRCPGSSRRAPSPCPRPSCRRSSRSSARCRSSRTCRWSRWSRTSHSFRRCRSSPRCRSFRVVPLVPEVPLAPGSGSGPRRRLVVRRRGEEVERVGAAAGRHARNDGEQPRHDQHARDARIHEVRALPPMLAMSNGHRPFARLLSVSYRAAPAPTVTSTPKIGV